MTLGSSSPHSVYSSFTVPFFFPPSMVPPSSHPLHHPIIFRPWTNPPTHSIQFFVFLSCQGFCPHPASSWPPSEVPSSSSLVVWPCPFSMVLYQSTHWPIGHLSFIMGLMSDSTWPGGHCLFKLVC